MTEQDKQPGTAIEVRQHDTSREIARADTDSWIGVVGEVSRFAAMVASTEFVPTSMRDHPAAVAAAILYGREVGLPPMTALTQTHVIEGRPSMSAEAMRALVLAAGHDIDIVESTGSICRVRGKRRGSDRWSSEVSWTIDAAKAAGLTGKKNWEKYPRRMLQARASSELCELLFPDVIHGFRSVEEMVDAVEGDGLEADPTTPVQRTTARKRAAKKATPAAPAASRPAADAGPPLPGEDVDETPAGAVRTAAPAGTGEAPGPVPETPVPALPDEDGVVDAELVDDDGAIPDPDELDDPAAEEQRRQAEEAAAQARGPRLANRAQVRAVNTILQKSFDVQDGDRHRVVSALIGRPITSLNEVTASEVSPLLDTLKLVDTPDALWALVYASEQRTADEEGRNDDDGA